MRRRVGTSVALVLLAGSLTAVGAGTVQSANASPLASAAANCTGTVGITSASGSGQTAKVNTAFASALSVNVSYTSDAADCPASGVVVTFTVQPGSNGASATFQGGGTTIEVASTQGLATTPALTAGGVTGTFQVQASAGSSNAVFSLSVTAVGAADQIVASGGSGQSTVVGTDFASPLQAEVTDAYGDPVAGTTVNFVITGSSGAGATFIGGGTSASAAANSSGVATSPALLAGSTIGSFSATATFSGATSTASFALSNVAAAPDGIVAGVGVTQETPVGLAFAVPLAVTVTDVDKNPVAGAEVTFTAPASGASGTFAGGNTSVTVATDVNGVADAPTFVANETVGGYLVEATVSGVSRPANFALVNEPPSGTSSSGLPGNYWLATTTGQVLTSGGAANYGGEAGARLAARIVGMAATPDGKGYWLVAADGGIFAFGDAGFYGSMGGKPLTRAVVGMAATPDGKGYWLVAADGGIFAFGDAGFYGSMGGRPLNKPVVGMAATPDGKGYWLVASDGGIFSFGDAGFHGSTGAMRLNQPVVGMARSGDGSGYWLVAADGGVFSFGDAGFVGSEAGSAPSPVVAIVAPPGGGGYYLASANGHVAGYGSAGTGGSGPPSGGTVVGGTAGP